MDTTQKPVIYLAVADCDRRRLWAQGLEMAGFRCLEPDAGRFPVAVDLVLSDLGMPELATMIPQSMIPQVGIPQDGIPQVGIPRVAIPQVGRRQDGPLAGRPAGAAYPPRDHGLILVGGAARAPENADARLAADACLAADATVREIELAARLVLEIVRLRRDSHSKAHSRNVLWQLALTDSLSGLGNRRAWRLALQRAWTQLEGSQGSVCLTILDLDRFKDLNDSAGHAAGDRALQIAGETLASAIRESDFAARLGGDEFGLLWMGLSGEAAGRVVERVRALLSERLSAATDNLLTASAGYAVGAGPVPPASEALLALADAGLQAAKRLGRNRAERGAAVAAGNNRAARRGADYSPSRQRELNIHSMVRSSTYTSAR